MKKLNVLVSLVMALMLVSNLFAQEEISNEDLRKYALMSEVITLMKKDISLEVNQMIKNQEGMTGKRYSELAKANGDEAKLAELEAKDFEIQFLQLVKDLKEKRIAAIKTVNQQLATKMVGDKGKLYKKIKSELASNTELKESYDQIVASIRMENQ